MEEVKQLLECGCMVAIAAGPEYSSKDKMC